MSSACRSPLLWRRRWLSFKNTWTCRLAALHVTKVGAAVEGRRRTGCADRNRVVDDAVTPSHEEASKLRQQRLGTPNACE